MHKLHETIDLPIKGNISTFLTILKIILINQS